METRVRTVRLAEEDWNFLKKENSGNASQGLRNLIQREKDRRTFFGFSFAAMILLVSIQFWVWFVL